MNRFRSVIPIFTASFLFFLHFQVALAGNPRISFFEGGLENLRQEAAKQDLPYVIYFALPQHEECLQIEQKTFTYNPLVTYISSHFLIYRVNGLKDAYARAMVRHYQVKGFPTLLVFGPEGQVWGQYFGYVSGQDLYEEFGRLVRAHSPSPVFSRGFEQTRSNQGTAEETLSPASPMTALNASPRSEIHYIRGLTEMQNYGIEVSRFTSMSELEQEVEKYERLWRGALITYTEVGQEQEYYHLILGAYESLEEAEAFATPMRQLAAIQTRIIDFRKLGLMQK